MFTELGQERGLTDIQHHVERHFNDSNVGQNHTWRFLWDPQRCVLFACCQASVCTGGWVRSCSPQSKGKDRLLGRGAASRVCCWPDQLAQLLSSGGVAHHNKGLWADRRLHSSYQPPSLRRSTALLLSRPSCGMQRANMEVLSFGKNERDINLEHMIAAHSAV